MAETSRRYTTTKNVSAVSAARKCAPTGRSLSKDIKLSGVFYGAGRRASASYGAEKKGEMIYGYGNIACGAVQIR